jgi:hypothetical protein
MEQPWRPQTSLEVELVQSLLAKDFPAKEAFRLAAEGKRVRNYCACPCGSFEFEPATDGSPPLSVHVEGFMNTEPGPGATVRVYKTEDTWNFEVCHLNEDYGTPLPTTLRLW